MPIKKQPYALLDKIHLDNMFRIIEGVHFENTFRLSSGVRE